MSLAVKRAPRGSSKMQPDNTGEKQDTRFQPGQSGNPAGRPKGARNKVSETLLETLAEHFEKHGKDAIEKVYAESPRDYLKIVASLVPRQMEIEDKASTAPCRGLVGR